ncbi:hypothetical protein EDC14_101171 [Hydrogenispora ethanolica]|jgi:hypothetical protein|uniref:Uncharacterized protein n=1 Tax=Hydrogenispora ethanolica TaxID=1082276 RepID=A0A4R1RU72_HYDET|nr:hypothetical protein [Hydrogenispora ethanolica]TCL69949.1 hypothetical protein EDC14_101171 [Hydrogenispora ethanolica]
MVVDYLRDISAFLVGGGFAAYLTKYLFDRYLAIELEKHKGKLSLELERFKHRVALETEQYKAKLHEASLEHEVKFTRLHEERAQIIRELYQRILKFSDNLRDQTIALSAGRTESGNQNGGSLMIDIVTDELIDLYSYFWEKRIYFSNELSMLVEQLFEKYLGQIQYSLNLRGYLKKCREDSFDGACDLERITVDVDQMAEAMNRLEEKLTQEFQELLGVK